MSRLFLKSCAMLAVSAEGVKIATTAAGITELTEKIHEASREFAKIRDIKGRGQTKCSQVDPKVFKAACGGRQEPTDATITLEISSKAVIPHLFLAETDELKRMFDEGIASNDVKKLKEWEEKALKHMQTVTNRILRAACCPANYKSNTCC
ncbi:unnamed protein product [Amoebophrya sp. A25]|nr:unnamed protein product [Amoebophrya sp. A25]|eukprot:GSA25T00022968001.1